MDKSTPEQCVRWMSLDIYDKLLQFTDNDWIKCHNIYPLIPSQRPNDLVECIVNMCTDITDVYFNTRFIDWIHHVGLIESFEIHKLLTSPYNYSDAVSDTPRITDILRTSPPITT